MYKRFVTEILVRPDDIDMNNHVHNSKYLDYVLFARYDQMGRCYGIPMNEFVKRGWGWVVKTCSIAFKRPLSLNDRPLVETWLKGFSGSDVTVGFRILRQEPQKVSAEGEFVYTMVELTTGRAIDVPDWIVKQYSSFVE